MNTKFLEKLTDEKLVEIYGRAQARKLAADMEMRAKATKAIDAELTLEILLDSRKVCSEHALATRAFGAVQNEVERRRKDAVDDALKAPIEF